MKIKEDLIIEQALQILEQRLQNKGACFNEPDNVRSFLTLKLATEEREHFGMILLDNRYRMISFEIPFHGTVDSASVYPRELVKLCLQHNASAVILSHNHPSGVPDPSQSDERITKRIIDALALIDVRVLDHFIIGGVKTVSFAELGLL